MPLPEKCSGEREHFRGFINQCKLHFQLQPVTFSHDAFKVGFILTLLQGKALTWASFIIEHNSPLLCDFEEFLATIATIFGEPDYTATAEATLLHLSQGQRSVAEHPLSAMEKKHRRQNNRCMYCEGNGHYVGNCPVKAGNSYSCTIIPEITTSNLFVPVTLSWGSTSVSVKAFVDSGAAGNFLDITFADKMSIPTVPTDSRPLMKNPLVVG
ncbi:hypothetical protein XELAEV_18004949mg [Xenopus laevis]|uniref:DUF4939 domain-containing protein n=1 Tax=Xenopus laevis TaxID=8355 RepID=A0A974DWB8_XENLA|nr:hypothetical protein XELAEV_18004949mg [Xenopus laevis]